MGDIKLYSKYMDKNHRMYIVVERFGNLDTSSHQIRPSQLKVLNVSTEKPEIVSVETFHKSISEGKLTQIPTP